MFDTTRIYKCWRSCEEGLGFTASPFLTGDVDVLCLCLCIFSRYDTFGRPERCFKTPSFRSLSFSGIPNCRVGDIGIARINTTIPPSNGIELAYTLTYSWGKLFEPRHKEREKE